MSNWEVLAAGFGLANMALLARRSVWNFPCGLAMVSIFAVLFFQARLYAVAALQIVFFVAQLHGLWAWRQAPAAGSSIAVRRLEPRRWPVVVSSGLGLWLLIALLLRQTDAAAPFSDAAVAGWSLVAQVLTNVRMVESWPLWLGINIASVALYAGQGLWITAGLYLIFLGLALISWRSWAQAAA